MLITLLLRVASSKPDGTQGFYKSSESAEKIWAGSVFFLKFEFGLFVFFKKKIKKRNWRVCYSFMITEESSFCAGCSKCSNVLIQSKASKLQKIQADAKRLFKDGPK